MGGGIAMRTPMRTIAAAITIGIMSATAVTVINYPTSIEAKAADTPSSTAPAEMSEAQIREAWKNLKVTVTDVDGRHELKFCDAAGFKYVNEHAIGLKMIGESKMFVTYTDIKEGYPTITGVPSGWKRVGGFGKGWPAIREPEGRAFSYGGGTLTDIYSDGTNCYAFEYVYQVITPTEYGLQQMFSDVMLTSDIAEDADTQIDLGAKTVRYRSLSRSGRAPKINFRQVPKDYKLDSVSTTDDFAENGGWASKATSIATFTSDKYKATPYVLTVNWENEAKTKADVAKIDEQKKNANANGNTNANANGNTNANDNANGNVNAAPVAPNASTQNAAATDAPSSELVQTGVTPNLIAASTLAGTSIIAGMAARRARRKK